MSVFHLFAFFFFFSRTFKNEVSFIHDTGYTWLFWLTPMYPHLFVCLHVTVCLQYYPCLLLKKKQFRER